MNFDRILILGAGAIGSVCGAFLSRSCDVTLIGNEAHVDAVNSKGLSISGDTYGTFHLKADTEIREIPEKTLIILTTKAYDSAKAMEKISRLLRKDTVVLVLQNGFGNEEIVRRIVGSKVKVFRGITTMAAEFFKPGEIRFWNGETIIEQDPVAREIAGTLNAAMLKTSLSNDIDTEIWSKVVINCVINALTAVFRVRTREIVADSLAHVRHELVRECVAVGKAEGIRVPKDLEEEIDIEISNYTNFSSMCQDVMKGSRTEIDFLNGKIVELGRKNHVPTPVNETLVCLIKFLEEKNELPRED